MYYHRRTARRCQEEKGGKWRAEWFAEYFPHREKYKKSPGAFRTRAFRKGEQCAETHPRQQKRLTSDAFRVQAQPGRGDWIRTSGLYVPNVALYQTEPHLEMAAEEGFEPSQTESESAVLPLHNSAISFLCACQTGRATIFIIAKFFHLSTPFCFFLKIFLNLRRPAGERRAKRAPGAYHGGRRNRRKPRQKEEWHDHGQPLHDCQK